jgi:hypothetical protein
VTTRGPYNPLDKLNLGQSVAQALLEAEVLSLSQTENLRGAGVYAIYYTGGFDAYAPIATLNRPDPEKGTAFAQPIYVGKAIPRGGRKGGLGPSTATGTALRDRLRQHAASIREANNLDLDDFQFRCLVVDDIWIPLGENMLIEQFKPVWNLVIDGFGNKDPGRRRATQYKSPWDVLHPGREFADKLADSGLKPEAIKERLAAFFAGQNVTLVEQPDEEEEDGQPSEE